MKKLNFTNPDNRDAEDLRYIMLIGLKNGYQIAPMQAYNIWSKYSETRAAGWLSSLNEDEVLCAIKFYGH